MIFTIVVIILILMFLGAVGHAGGNVNFAWPGGALGLVLVIVLILLLLGYR